jgi:peptidoglycan/xylan/chitin deacetylase (PgdA/CDA1 family)
VTPEIFEHQIQWLSKHKTIVPLNEVVNYVSGGISLPSDAVVLTFDDGYRDYVEQALPILEKYEAPSTVYVSTELMHKQVAPYEFRLAAALQRADCVTVTLDGVVNEYDLSTENGTKTAYTELRQTVKDETIEARESLLAQLNETKAESFRIMTPEMVDALDENQLVTIGSHSHEHRPHGSLLDDEIRANMSRAKMELSQIIDQKIRHLSFPYGSVSLVAMQIAEDIGYESAVGTTSRTILPRDWNNCYSLPRIDMSQPSSVEAVNTN